MSAGAYAAFATVFGMIAFGHGVLALITWRKNHRTWHNSHLRLAADHGRQAASREYRRTGPFIGHGQQASFNFLVAAAVFFAGVAIYCAASAG